MLFRLGSQAPCVAKASMARLLSSRTIPACEWFAVSKDAERVFERMQLEMVLDNPSLSRISLNDKIDYLMKIAFPKGVEEYCARWDRRIQVLG